MGAYHAKLREAEGNNAAKLGLGEISAFSGTSRAGDLLMVAPPLLDHLKGVVEKDALAMNNLRKAREERDARKTGKN